MTTYTDTVLLYVILLEQLDIEQLDLLHEARMIEEIKSGEVTELHDISWESVGECGTRSVGCQTRYQVNYMTLVGRVWETV